MWPSNGEVHLMQCTYPDIFSTAQHSFWSHWFWCLFSVSAIFCFTSYTSAKHFCLRTFFIWAWKKKAIQGEIGYIHGCVGREGHVIFGRKLVNSQCQRGQACLSITHHEWANMLSLQKSSLKSNIASHNTTSWHTDTDGFLERSPTGGNLYYKGPALQKIILCLFSFFRSPWVCDFYIPVML